MSAVLKSMPSPNGTNREKLFVLQGRGGGGFAYDASPDSPAGSSIEELIAWAKDNLEPDDIKQLVEELKALVPASDPDPAASDSGLRLHVGLGSSHLPPSARPNTARAEADFRKQFGVGAPPRHV